MPPKLELTPSERKELKLKKKAEKKIKLLERKNQIKRDQLERELQYGSVTLKRQEKNWRKLLIGIKLPEMRQELELAWHEFEKIIDCKDFKISLLMDELIVAEEQYFLNLTTHSEHIDELINLFENTMYELDNNYKREVEELQVQHQNTVEEIQCTVTEGEFYLKTMLHILNVEMNEVNQNRQTEYFSKLEEEDTRQSQLVQKMKGILEQVHLQLWSDTIDFLDKYNERIKVRKKAHNQLKFRDDEIQKVIKNQIQSIHKSYDLIRKLKLTETEQQKFLGRRLEELESEFNFFSLLFDKLKAKLSSDTKLDETSLRCLTINYNNIIQIFDDIEIKGKRLLQISAICRKLETLEEKILAFPVNFDNELSIKKGDINQSAPILELFWQRVGNATVLAYRLDKEHQFLLKENEWLKKSIHQYCQCLTCLGNKPIEVTLASVPLKPVCEDALEKIKVKSSDLQLSDSDNLYFDSSSKSNINI